MKITSSLIVFLAVVSFAYLFAPGNASAQIKPPWPCCLNSPSTPADGGVQGAFMQNGNFVLTADSLSRAYSTNPNRPSPGNIMESDGKMQNSSAPKMPSADREYTLGLLANDREIYYRDMS
jgi:hypothetical protein